MSKKKSREMVDGVMRAARELQGYAKQGMNTHDIVEHYRKHRPDRIHTYTFKEPGKHTPAMVKRLRAILNVSQATFARMLGVSTVLVQSWEQGKREPSPLARRLLDMIGDDPKAWSAKIFGRRAG